MVSLHRSCSGGLDWGHNSTQAKDSGLSNSGAAGSKTEAKVQEDEAKKKMLFQWCVYVDFRVYIYSPCNFYIANRRSLVRLFERTYVWLGQIKTNANITRK